MDGSVDKRPPLLQTYGLQLNESSAVEMCTFVRKVLEDSAAENAGLTAGEPPTPFTRAYTHTHTHAYESLRPHCAFLLYIWTRRVSYHRIANASNHKHQTLCNALLSSHNSLVHFFFFFFASPFIRRRYNRHHQ